MQIISKHCDEYGKKPQVIAQVPGVIKLAGSYAEDCRGQVICATDSRRMYVSMSLRSDNQVFIKNAITDESKHFALSSLRFKKEDKWANYAKAILSLVFSANVPDQGFDFVIDGNLPQDVAVVIGILTAVNSKLKLNLSDQDIQDYVYKACNLVGGDKKTLSEIQTMLFAKPDKFVLCDTNKGTYSYLDNTFKNDVSLLVVDSSISVDFIKDLFDDVAYSCSKAMEEFKKAYRRDSFINMMDADFSDRLYPISSETRQICTFLYDEYKSVLKIKKFINPLEPQMVGTALAKIQRVVSDKLEITCPEIEWIIKRANEVSGCYGATSILYPSNLVAVLIKTKDVDSFLNKIEDYEHIFGLTAKVEIFTPGDCAKVVSDENSVNKR